MSSAQPSAPARRRRRPVLIVLLVLVALLVAGLVAAGLWVNGLARGVDEGVKRFEGQSFPEESTRPQATGEAKNFLLVGEDGGAENRDDQGRSDSLMLVHVPADRQDVQIISLMRDMYVDIPGHGKDRINAAYQFGRVPLTVQTVEDLFDVRIDHVVGVDLAGFPPLIDAIGGITVDNPREFTRSGREDLHYAKGLIHLDGDQALNYARERYAFPESDFMRVQNQQRVVKGIVDKLISTDTLANPGRIQDSVDAFSPYLTFDEDLGSGEIASLAWSLRDVRSADLHSFTAPTAGVGYTEDGKDVVWPDEDGLRRLGEALRTDTVDEFEASAQR